MRHLHAALASGLVLAAGIPLALGQPAPGGPGDAAFSQGDFDAAARAYAARLAAAPEDAGALVGLARVRLYEGRTDEAADLARRALAAAPDDPAAQRAAREVQMRKDAFAPDRFVITAPGGETRVPFVATDPLPIVQATVNGSHKAYFLIDTGAPNIVLDRDFARELGLATETAGQGVFAGGRRAAVERTLLAQLELGAVKVSNVPAAVLPTRGFALRPDLKIDGIIGAGLLEHFLATIDYCGGALALRPRGASASFERRAREAGDNVVAMWLVPDHFVFVRARLNQGRAGLFMVDTGMAGGGLGATKATLDDAGVVLDPSRAHTGVGGGGTVTVTPFKASATLGAMTVKDVPGLYGAGADRAGAGPGPFTRAGMLSHMFFRHSRLSFDFAAMRLVTRACPAAGGSGGARRR